MIYIAVLAVAGVLLLQASGAIPMASVGGPMAIAFVYFAAVLAVAIHEAVSRKRGVIGWIVNILVAFVGAMIVTPVAGEALAILLASGSGSLAAGGGPRFAFALVGGMLAALLGAWGAIRLVNRVRKG